MVSKQENLDEWIKQYPILKSITNLHPIVWLNSNKKPMNRVTDLVISRRDVEEADQLWYRFAPFLEKVFPETMETKGIIESPLKEIPFMKVKLEQDHSINILGAFYLKCDNELPIAGSIKARGGIYEILHFAESLAINAGLITMEDNYSEFTNPAFKKLFQQYTIGVGSTGNLGLSIGIISAKLGFNVSVYMSQDAKQWKKDLLRAKGAIVHEFAGDFSVAIDAGRNKTIADPKGYFVDDEDSKHLFLGYSVAALRLQQQLNEKNIKVDKDHPLFVYLPCGVGGSPGGITFGLKQVFGDDVHCFFVEPTHSPSVLIGLLTREMDKISVQDLGIDNHTEADGLAVGRPSSFATPISDQLISGIYTIEDDDLYKLLSTLADSQDIFVEPSATAGLLGPIKIAQSKYAKMNNLNMAGATHIAWATGGALVPEIDVRGFYEKGKSLMK